MNTNLWLCHILSEKHHKTLSPELCKHFQSQISRRSSFMRSINTRPLGMTGLFSSAWSSSLLPSRPVDVTLPPPPPETVFVRLHRAQLRSESLRATVKIIIRLYKSRWHFNTHETRADLKALVGGKLLLDHSPQTKDDCWVSASGFHLPATSVKEMNPNWSGSYLVLIMLNCLIWLRFVFLPWGQFVIAPHLKCFCFSSKSFSNKSS